MEQLQPTVNNPDLSPYPMPEWDHPPKRVVSLVPSITESLFDLGFGGSLVGISDYCTQPAGKVGEITRVGGPKNPDIETIKGLAPDLVIGNPEENNRKAVEGLADAGIPVWLVFPKTVQDGLDMLRQFLALYHTDNPVMMVNTLQIGLDYAISAAAAQPRVRYFCPIWTQQHSGTDWWMSFNDDTYPGDLLKNLGGENVFARRKRKYPLAADLGLEPTDLTGERDDRYPRVTAGEVVEAQPELILLPDDPFQFREEHRQTILRLLADTPAVQNNRVNFIDGSLLTWYGTRLGKALQALPEYFFPI
jgi:ABC-type Fe3+-hydroxamate transport system substrate-binding protein